MLRAIIFQMCDLTLIEGTWVRITFLQQSACHHWPVTIKICQQFTAVHVPKWLKCGGVAYALPLKSTLCGNQNVLSRNYKSKQYEI